MVYDPCSHGWVGKSDTVFVLLFDITVAEHVARVVVEAWLNRHRECMKLTSASWYAFNTLYELVLRAFTG